MPDRLAPSRRRSSAASPAPSQGIIDDRQELRRCEYVALGPVRAADVSGGTHSGSGLTLGVTLAQKRMICPVPDAPPQPTGDALNRRFLGAPSDVDNTNELTVATIADDIRVSA